MDVIGHDYIFIYGRVGKVFWNLKKKLCGDLSEAVELLRAAEDTLFLMGADRNEIGIGKRVVILGDSVRLAFGVIHADTSVRTCRSVAVAIVPAAERS